MPDFTPGFPSWSGNLAVLLAKATIILVAAVAITRQMHRASAGARHLVWLVTLGTLLFVPALTAWAPLALRILPPRTVATDVACPLRSQRRAGRQHHCCIGSRGASGRIDHQRPGPRTGGTRDDRGSRARRELDAPSDRSRILHR